MSTIENVAVLGKGFLGTAITEQLVKAKFTVTILSRAPKSLKDLPAGVKTAQADYSSVDGLAEILRGQDAVVSTVGTSGIRDQGIVIDASIQAGVKRYIPSDWGALSTDPTAESLPLYRPFQDIQKYLKHKASSGGIEYTIFAIGPLLEYVISTSFVVDVNKHTVDLHDNGAHPFSSTSASSVGRAVAGALKNAPMTKNRLVRVHDIVLTQKKVLALAQKYGAPNVEWRENAVDACARLEEILAIIKQGDLDLSKWLALLQTAVLCGKFCAEYDPPDNDLVGLPFMSEDDFEKLYSAGFQKSLFDIESLEGVQK